MRVIPERPRVGHIELLILFALYSLVLNRRHSAYRWIGSAMRLGLFVGLHQNIHESQLPDRAARQHRNCLWWTVYIIDRMLGAKFGYPSLIRDDDIDVNLPSDSGLTPVQKEGFLGAEYLIAHVNLARIAGNIITILYSRKKLDDTFSQRVHKIFRDLRTWFEALPEDMQLRNQGTTQVAKHILSLHLFFNQVRHCLLTFPALANWLVCYPCHSTYSTACVSCFSRHQPLWSVPGFARDSTGDICSSRDMRP